MPGKNKLLIIFAVYRKKCSFKNQSLIRDQKLGRSCFDDVLELFETLKHVSRFVGSKFGCRALLKEVRIVFNELPLFKIATLGLLVISQNLFRKIRCDKKREFVFHGYIFYILYMDNFWLKKWIFGHNNGGIKKKNVKVNWRR